MKDSLTTEKYDILSLISKHRSALMGFAALCIFVFHEYIAIGNESSKLYIIQELVAARGYVGVDIFFLLSGMGLTYSVRKTNTAMFYYKRLRRVFFPFAAVGFCYLIARQWSVIDFIKNVSGYSFIFVRTYKFLWFVPAIMILYLFFPLYDKVISKASNKITFTALVIGVWLLATMLTARLVSSIGREDIYFILNRIPIFVIGVLLGYLSQSRRVYMTKSGWALMIVMNLTGFYLNVMTSDFDWQLLVPMPNCFVPNILMSISATFILSGVFEWISRFKISVYVKAIFDFFGKISLEFYCVQETLGKIILNKLDGHSAAVKNIAVFAGCIVAGLILFYAEKYFWKFVELPFAKKSRKKE